MPKPTNQKPQLPLSNQAVAEQLEAVAELLDAQQANPYRVQAYRNAATLLRTLTRPVAEIVAEEGITGLQQLAGIGVSLANSIQQLVLNGSLPLLQRLQGEIRPERVLATVAGVGPKLAEMIHEKLGVETLAELEEAVYNGRLERLHGFGKKRVRGVRESLASRLHRRPALTQRQRLPSNGNLASVADLLDIDREYRQKARSLPRIAPHRFNPTGEAWLPVLHTVRAGVHYTALYSNTAHAHELGMTHDWVVIYRDDKEGNGQWTVITSQYGPLKGHRIVRGRENECEDYYTPLIVKSLA